MNVILIATRNTHKVTEIRSILGDTFQYLTLQTFPDAPEVIEDAPTFAGNATKKAVELAHWLAATAATSKVDFVLADDSGLEVDALNGAPGVHSARFAALDSGAPGNSSDRDNCAKLSRLLKDVPNNSLQVVSYSVRPQEDSTAALVRFAAKHEITDPRWHFVSASPETVQRLARESYFVRLGADTTYGVKNIAHTESLVLVDQQGRLRGVYAGTLPLEIQRLREDAEVLLKAR